jgi:two-component system, chemotaxis family, CheB/CheR fusion protein
MARILVVEDHADTARTLSMLLRLKGHETRSAPDGPSGLAEALSWRPDGVVCDIGLPGLDGWELAARLRAGLGPSAVLIALTGYCTAADVERSREAGFDHHLAKPADPDELIAALGPARGA